MDSTQAHRAAQLAAESIELRPEARPVPTLLPAFEPSSSPFPRPQSAKRKFTEGSPTFPKQQLKYYPTPVPTSSTGALGSSSPNHERPGLSRTISTLSERAPLGSIPSVHLPPSGEIVRMGRSSNSSDFQLSANRLISRVHVQAAYQAPTASYPQGRVEIECLGWNGAKIHCRGSVFDLEKGDTYVSENPDASIMLDVQDTRVMIEWPSVTPPRKSAWDSDEETTPTRRNFQHLASSPPVIPRSPVSQSPARPPVYGLTPVPPSVPLQIFEDGGSDENADQCRDATPTPDEVAATFRRPNISHSDPAPEATSNSFKPSLLASFGSDDYSDADEENDPVVHSFGPYGDNLLPRLASFNAGVSASSPVQRRRRPLFPPRSPQRNSSDSIRFQESPVKNHVINQLAFSRLHSLPISTIHSNLPADLKTAVIKSEDDADNVKTPVPMLSKADLKGILDDIPCVGEIPRSGKDAAGKPLENEFYYVPEMDADEGRRETVTSGRRGSGIRSQYYWKRPRV
ncbi:hypothetical protein M011DRAFT_458291 [Sporormia fimetaria CBS 119925]|uniref:FHA domain-containing protein n=1 Tax=Sporormia fimetaria CBS 119925 TaxID=1340428 RepID=A0A6A6VDQ1_9PLEO|nr:hypothetical protein M011DRAFT_458291 [Sporormia fimetaria CBS 119925]